MLGLKDIQNEQNMQVIEQVFKKLYYQNMYDLDLMEDMIMLTPARKDICTDIGTGTIRASTFNYLVKNILWINVCLYVNEDFRSCFDDAIAIEKALTQVNDLEYKDFREDMILSNSEDGTPKSFVVDFTKYNPSVSDTVISFMIQDLQVFKECDMLSVYTELMETFDEMTLQSLRYIIHNMVYIVNAMDKNGVFHKYVTLVVDSVRKQLS